jgi:tyrosyl-tRNA synthetase
VFLVYLAASFLLPFLSIGIGNLVVIPANEFLQDLQQRGLVHQMSGDDELSAHLQQPRTVYCGFDPTADSLHIGSLVPLLALRRFQLAGHRPVILLGGATGLIGDPSFKAQERKLNSPDVVAEWVGCLREQVSRFVDFDRGDGSALMVNNLEWLESMPVLDFLRNVGKHFAVNSMIHKESVKQRLEREGDGISFTEFTYLLLQSYDFSELYHRHGCTVQVGGSDQWGNITGGIELTRRIHRTQVFGLTLPLVTKADGSKFGKTESGTIWLDAKKTSPYAFYQFWLNTADADVYRFLQYFTFLPVSEIHAIEASDRSCQGRPQAQGVLAREITSLVHGNSGLEAAERITAALFSGSHEKLTLQDYQQLQQDGLPSTEILPDQLSGCSLIQLLTDAGMAPSGKQVKDALGSSGIQLNGVVLAPEDNMKTTQLFSADSGLYGRYFLVRLGKKKYHLFYFD